LPGAYAVFRDRCHFTLRVLTCVPGPLSPVGAGEGER